MDQVAFRNAKGFDVKYKVVAIRARADTTTAGQDRGRPRSRFFHRSENAFSTDRPSAAFNRSRIGLEYIFA